MPPRRSTRQTRPPGQPRRLPRHTARLPRHAARRTAATLLLVSGLVAGLGCTQRTITITSEPDGALVLLNDLEVGRTPVTVPFTYYGTYSVQLTRDGYEPLTATADLDAPWWEYPGPDLVAEAIPGTTVQRRFHYELVPAEDADVPALIDRARSMRGRVLRQPDPPARPHAAPDPRPAAPPGDAPNAPSTADEPVSSEAAP